MEYATTRQAVNEWVEYVGYQNPETEYLLSDYDTWEVNPHYRGPKGPHPEDEPAWGRSWMDRWQSHQTGAEPVPCCPLEFPF